MGQITTLNNAFFFGIILGKTHAPQIGEMAIKILDVIRNFTLPQLPDTQIRIRIGLHSGKII